MDYGRFYKNFVKEGVICGVFVFLNWLKFLDIYVWMCVLFLIEVLKFLICFIILNIVKSYV